VTRKKKLLLWAILGPLLLGAVLLAWPLPKAVRNPEAIQPVRVLDRNGRVLYEARRGAEGSHDAIDLDAVPEQFIRVLLATEDRRFRSHHGISVRGIARALWQNATAGRVVSGASTLTQQFVRVRLGQGSRSYFGKLREAVLAIKVDLAFSKDEILEGYVNGAYFGHQAYGAASAAEIYFGKRLEELSLGETSLLIGLLQSPSALDPFSHPEAARKRRRLVLDGLVAQQLISAADADAAAEEPLHLGTGKTSIQAPHFVFWLLDRLGERAKTSTEIRSTLDLPLQQETERIVSYRLEALKEKNVTSAAVVVLDARTGDVLTMVGSADYFDTAHDGSVNVATSARQPGSALKPFTYAAALQRGDTAATVVADVESQFFTQEGNPYVPRNYDYSYHGLVRYREALANSYNIAAVKTLERVGVGTLLTLLKAAGLSTLTESPEHYGLALTLGDAEVTPLELAQAFGVFARGGETLPIRATLDEEQGESQRILDQRIAWIIADILSDNDARLEEFGEDNALAFPWRVGAKTGTTRNSRDNWTVGFTADRIVAVWVGNADNSPMKDTSGVTGAGPIFHDVMVAATRDRPPAWLPRPAGISEVEVCKLSGMLPTQLCPLRIREYFVQGTEPSVADTIYREVPIDRRNGLLASSGCGQDNTEHRVFAFFPLELETWARENGWPRPPSRWSPLCPSGERSTATGAIRIVTPQNGDSFQLDPLVPDENERVPLTADVPPGIPSVGWFVNGVRVGTGTAPAFRQDWSPTPGRWTIRAEAGDRSASVTIDVTER